MQHLFLEMWRVQQNLLKNFKKGGYSCRRSKMGEGGYSERGGKMGGDGFCGHRPAILYTPLPQGVFCVFSKERSHLKSYSCTLIAEKMK